MAPKRILSLDGGGLRGVATLAFLEALEARLSAEAGRPVAMHEHFDLIGGTSTGAIIAAALALGHPLEKIKQYYFRLGPNVFRGAWNRIPLLHARFPAAALKREVLDIAGERTFDSPDLLTGLAIVTKRMDTGSVWVLTNNDAAQYWDDPPDGSYVGNRHYRIADVLRASTAAPHYFDPEVIRIGDSQTGLFVDGGVSPHNNPSLLLFQLATIPSYGYGWATGADRLDITSIGTGSHRHRFAHKSFSARISVWQAVSALRSIMADCDANALTMMQALGKCETPAWINSEIGDLCGVTIPPEPLFTFRRYNLHLERDALAELGETAVTDRDLADLRDIANIKAMRRVYALAKKAAARQFGH